MKTTKTNVPDSEIVRARENQAAGSDDAKLVADRETKATTVAGNGGGTVTTPQPRAASAAAASEDAGVEPTPESVAGEPTDGDAGGESLAELRKRERIIRQGQDFWRDGATALMEIRDLRLYNAKGFTDFGKYCREKLEIGKSTVNRHIAIAEVYQAVASTEAKILPTSERQMRPMLPLRRKDQEPSVWGKDVAKVWTKVVQDAEITKETITQKKVIRAIQQLELGPKPKESQAEHDLEKRWLKLEAQITHEAEFWPGEHRHDLRVRIVGLISGWDTGTKVVDSHPDDPGSTVAEAPPATAPEASPAELHGDTAGQTSGEVSTTATTPGGTNGRGEKRAKKPSTKKAKQSPGVTPTNGGVGTNDGSAKAIPTHQEERSHQL